MTDLKFESRTRTLILLSSSESQCQGHFKSVNFFSKLLIIGLLQINVPYSMRWRIAVAKNCSVINTSL